MYFQAASDKMLTIGKIKLNGIKGAEQNTQNFGSVTGNRATVQGWADRMWRNLLNVRTRTQEVQETANNGIWSTGSPFPQHIVPLLHSPPHFVLSAYHPHALRTRPLYHSPHAATPLFPSAQHFPPFWFQTSP